MTLKEQCIKIHRALDLIEPHLDKYPSLESVNPSIQILGSKIFLFLHAGNEPRPMARIFGNRAKVVDGDWEIELANLTVCFTKAVPQLPQQSKEVEL